MIQNASEIPEIHPAPSEFTSSQLSQDPILHFFHYAHLPTQLKQTSRNFFLLAHTIISTVPRNAERTVALRKLLEAKDAAVRANLPPPRDFQTNKPIVERDPAGSGFGEPVETGGHDPIRDGDPPFDG